MSTARNAAPPVVRFDRFLMAEDLAVKGWSKVELANRAGVADMTVIRFLRGEHQTPQTAKKLSKALGYSVRRYLIPVDRTERKAS